MSKTVEFTALIDRVVDGDTLHCEYFDIGFNVLLADKRIRLWGINCPESIKSKKTPDILPGLKAKLVTYFLLNNMRKWKEQVGKLEDPMTGVAALPCTDAFNSINALDIVGAKAALKKAEAEFLPMKADAESMQKDPDDFGRQLCEVVYETQSDKSTISKILLQYGFAVPFKG